ncbi:spidroin-1-like [Lethenteron reissneri]|uniref:spidroin-1-like n=1 Tax=Lethenteron reissneri TaxID=7753 RepID=UPI002AB63512|nr:spidroin-1-like [Lethenteron reissneri]XP_061434731.1 spidroin-1-like [Lethenteron reissneri]XP_061434732.1 spidroin-1-like [Lethenteron reissneri]
MARACLLLSLAAAVVGYQAKDETHVRVERLEQHVNETEFVYIRHAYVHTATRLREDTKRDAAAAAATATAGAAAAGAATAAAGCHHTFVVPPHLPAGPICVLQEGAGAPQDAGTPAGVAATAVVDKFWAELGTHGRQLALLQRQLSDLDDSAEIGEKFEEDLVVAAAAAAAVAAAGGGDGGATGGGSGGATSVGLRAAVQALRRAGRAVGERVTALYARILRETVLDRGGGGGDYGGGGGQSGSRQGRTLHAARSELHKRVSEQETHSLGLHGHYVRIQSTYDALSETVGNHTATLARLGLRCCHQRPLDAQQPPPPPDPRRATSSLPSAERGADGGGGAVASPIPSPDRAWRATTNGGDSAGSETSYGCGKGGGGGSGGGGDAAGRLATGERESERTPALATQTARRQHGAGDGWAGKQGLSAVGGGGANWAPGSDGGREVGNRGGGGAAAAPDNAVMRHGSRDAAVPPAPDKGGGAGHGEATRGAGRAVARLPGGVGCRLSALGALPAAPGRREPAAAARVVRPGARPRRLDRGAAAQRRRRLVRARLGRVQDRLWPRGRGALAGAPNDARAHQRAQLPPSRRAAGLGWASRLRRVRQLPRGERGGQLPPEAGPLPRHGGRLHGAAPREAVQHLRPRQRRLQGELRASPEGRLVVQRVLARKPQRRVVRGRPLRGQRARRRLLDDVPWHGLLAQEHRAHDTAQPKLLPLSSGGRERWCRWWGGRRRDDPCGRESPWLLWIALVLD